MKIAFICPDYGSQFVGMAKELYDQSRIMQEYFEEASTCLNINFVKLCFASSEYELGQMIHASPAIFLVSVSIAALLKEKGIVPNIVAGLGIGELSAASIAGSISMPDGLYFLSKYAHFYQDLLQGMQVRSIKITGIPLDSIKNICEQHDAALAVVETEHDVIITGPANIIEKLEKDAELVGGHSFQQSIERGLHSSLMQPVLHQLRVYLEKIDFRDTEIPVVASETGNLLTHGPSIQEQIMAQLQLPVRWDLVTNELIRHADLVVEMAPGIALTTQLKKMHPEIRVMSINKPSDVDDLIAYTTKSSSN